MTFQQKIDQAMEKNSSLVCVGLDPVMERLPQHVQKVEHPFFEFNKAIIEATHDLVCAYKPNSAFYEALGEQGIHELKMTCEYLQKTYPEIPIILDAKRGDIGSTNEGYAKYAFEYLGADAITLHPYLGKESLEPFFAYAEKGLIFLCRTSNPDSGEFQDLLIDNQPLYKKIAMQVAEKWNSNKNCLLVVGATYPKELQEIRKLVGDMTLLIPGIGTQGGDIHETITAGKNSKGQGMIISSSRAIIFAGNENDFAEKARGAAQTTRDEINLYR